MAPWLTITGSGLDLFTPSWTISLNHNQLQELTVNDCPRLSPFSFSSIFHNCQLRKSILLYSPCTNPTENSLYFWQSLFTTPLPSNRSPMVPRVCFCGNVFSDPLPSNRHRADHIENISCSNFYIVACSYFGFCIEMDRYVTTRRAHTAVIHV
jgi:hypothetical protein